MSYYDTVILADGASVYDHLNETSGTVAHDSTTNGYNGTLAGTITYSQPGAINGDSDTSLLFGANATLSMPWAQFNIATWTTISLEFWIKQTGVWHHVVATSTSTTTTLYLDGVVTTSGSGSGDPICIDQEFAFGGTFNSADLAKVAVYHLVLSPSQVLHHFSVGFALLAGGFGCFANGTGTATFDYFRATHFPDPALSLAPVIPRMGTSLVSWDATTSTLAQLGMDVSADGVNWSEMSNGAAMSFDGSTGYISLPTTSLPTGASPWSLEAWCRFSGASSSGNKDLIAFGTLSNQQAAILRVFSNGSAYQPILSTNNGDIAGSYISTLNTAIHLVGTYDGTNTRLYVNGALVAGPTPFTLNIILTFANIAAAQAAFDWFPGTIDEPAIYGVALSAQQVIAHYNSGIGIAATPTYNTVILSDAPLRWYRLNDTATTAIDSGSQAQNGTLHGGIVVGVTGLITNRNGLQLPEYFVQPDPTIDGFATNTSTNYTSTFRTGGASLTPTFDTTNSRLALTGGINGIYTYTAISRTDVDFFADLDRSDAGGLVWRFVDANNFYQLLIADNQASSGTPNTITLYRVASNVQTQLAQATLVTTYGTGTGTSTMRFYRGTYHRIRVAMLGSTITASFDGAQLISYTDGSPLSTAGNVGLYNNGGTVGSRYYQLWIQPQGDYVAGTPAGDLVTGDFLYTRQRLATTDATTTPQVLDLTTMGVGPNIRNGVQLASLAYTYNYIGKSYDDLAKASNYSWYIGVDTAGNQTIHFGPNGAVASPWILQSTPQGIPSDFEHDSNHALETASNTMYRNRQILTGVIGTATFGDPFVGDGKKTSFTLRYPIAAGFVPTITKNNAAQTVGLKGTTGAQWYYAVGDPVISQDTSGTVLQSTDTLIVSPYTGTFSTSVVVDNIQAQQALAQTEKSSGIVEEVEDVSKMQLNVAAATTYANQLLARYCLQGRTITFKTYRTGLEVLQILTAFVPEYNLVNAQLLIIEIDETFITQPNNTVQYGYIVTASELPYIKGWASLLASNLLTNG